MNSRSRTSSSPLHLARVDPTQMFQDLITLTEEVLQQAAFIRDEDSAAECRKLTAEARKATLTYRALIEDIDRRLRNIYGSRPEEFARLADARVASLLEQGYPYNSDQGYKDNVVHLTKGARTG